jgi:uncharacterized membrane protein YczE
MTGIHNRTGWPVAWVRLGLEASVLVIGWLWGYRALLKLKYQM